jgi:hypothetical protein
MHFYMHSYVDKKIILVKSECYNIALGSSCAHLPFGWSSNIFFTVENISGFAFSTASLD